jgi:hypothetical protein
LSTNNKHLICYLEHSQNKSIKDGYAYTEWDLTRDASVSYFDDKQLANATDIGLACLILHESYHAYLHYKYRNYSIDPSYESLFEYNYSEKEEHEKWVEDDFIAAMASTLYTFGTSKGYPYTIEFYKKIAWGGLKDTDVYNSKEQQEKEEINDAVLIELTGKDSKNDKKIQKGKGTDC